uniref:Uncharacterized protein n=1 Tax=Glossina morsitans morsitans TaxID=37546 RepID=A0A1B0F945_GLOMM
MSSSNDKSSIALFTIILKIVDQPPNPKEARQFSTLLKTSLTNEIKTRDDDLKVSLTQEIRKRNMVEPGSLPFLFGVLGRKNNYFGHGTFTTELGKWSSDITKTDYMLQLLAGSHTYNTDYVSFYRPRQLSFIEGSKGTFIYGELCTKNFSGSYDEIYYYPYAALGVVFVKNTTNVNINKTMEFVGSSYSSTEYGGAGLFVGTPDNTNSNKSSILKIVWKNVYQYTSSDSKLAGSGNVEIPAGKTVAILLYTSSYLYSRTQVSQEEEKIVERNKEDIELELLENAKLSALDSVRFYFNNYTNEYAGNSHQKASVKQQAAG